jgi:transcriptional regulator with GAF, ATPase, and Fis domain
MVTTTPLTRSLGVLSRFYVGDCTIAEALERVSELTVEAVEPADFAGITMDIDGHKRTAVFTDIESPEIDQAQYDAGDGPCLAAYRERRVTSIEATDEPGRWPEFRRSALAHGIGSTLSLPLLVETRAVGALNLYARPARAFSQSDRETAKLFASHAAVVLANAQAYWDKHDLSVGLGEAMRHRSVIEQAKGVLMGAEGIDEEAAFAMLVKASQRENLKVRAIAHRIVESAVARTAQT